MNHDHDLCPRCRGRKRSVSRVCARCRYEDLDFSFWQKVDRSGGTGSCWPWTGWRDAFGYGHHVVMGQRRKAHRTAVELTIGSIPAGLMVCHRCDNPPCCNPAHLFIGTMADNMRDAQTKGRIAKGERSGAKRHPERYPRGEARTQARLTDGAVRELRALRAAGVTWAVLAARFRIGIGTARSAVNGRSWTHV